MSNADDMVAPGDILKLFDGCRIVDGLQWVLKDNGPGAAQPFETYRIGCALRFDDAQSDNQRLKNYAWFLHMPSGEFVVGPFLDARVLNEVIDAARNGESRHGTDPSMLLGEALDVDAGLLHDVLAAQTTSEGVRETFEQWAAKPARQPQDIRKALEAGPGEGIDLDRGLAVFKDIDSARAQRYVILLENYSKRVAGYVIDKGGKAAMRIGRKSVEVIHFAGAMGQAGQEIALSLAGPEVQAVTRALLALNDRLEAISEKLGEKVSGLRNELGKHKDGATFSAGNRIGAAPGAEKKAEAAHGQTKTDQPTSATDRLSSAIAAVRSVTETMSRKEKGRLWDTYFDQVREGERRHEITTPAEKKALAASLGLTESPEAAVERVCTLAMNDALVNNVIEQAMKADLLTNVDAVVDKVLSERRLENDRRRQAAEKKGEKPRLLSRYTDEGFPVRRETIGPYVNARVNAIRAENLMACEKYLKNGQQPTANQVRLFTARNLAGASLLTQYTGHKVDEALMNKAMGLATGNFQVEPASETLAVKAMPTAAQQERPDVVQTQGLGRRLVQTLVR